MVENCEGFGKACVFFVCSAEVGLIDFFEEGLVVFDGKPVISDYDVLDFKFIVYLLLTALVHLSKASNHKNILLDGSNCLSNTLNESLGHINPSPF